MVLLGIALLRARAVPRWVAIALMVSQPMHLVSAVILPSRLLDVTLGWGLTTIAFAAVAVTILRTRNDDWDLPPAIR
jgi:multisubunit Na+/H+ antiporter MnhB subunit